MLNQNEVIGLLKAFVAKLSIYYQYLQRVILPFMIRNKHLCHSIVQKLYLTLFSCSVFCWVAAMLLLNRPIDEHNEAKKEKDLEEGQ